MNKRENKKAVSPVIATVLLVALVLVMALIIFLWARGFLTEQLQKNGVEIATVCDQVNYEAELVSTTNGYELKIANNGNIPIYQFEAKVMDTSGNAETVSWAHPVDVGEVINAQLSSATDLGSALSIDIYPLIATDLQSGSSQIKVYSCVDFAREITLGT
jgi:flagellin-like protein